MKKLLLIATAALILASCKGGSETATEQEAKVQVSKEYNSADLAMQELKGQVKSMEYYTYECNEQGENPEAEAPGYEHMKFYFNFDEKGTMTNGYAYNKDVPGPKLVRGESGQIAQIEEYFKEMNFTFVNKFSYNENGNIKSDEVLGYEATSKTTYVYNDKGDLVSSSSSQEGEGILTVTDATYEIKKTDDHGNWTRRLMKSTSKESRDGKVMPNTNGYVMEVRDIVYY